MGWEGGSRWRKAWIISLVLHSVVLTSAGWMAEKALLSVGPPETLIELELINEPGPVQATNMPEQDLVNAESVGNIKQQIVVNQPVAIEPVVAVSSMSVELVNTSVTVPASARVSGVASGAAAGGLGSRQSAGGGSSKSQEIVPPGILSHREPAYPEQARRAGIEGTVVLRIEILESGRTGAISVARSSGAELLDNAAIAAVQRWRFVPAKVRGTGQAISCQTTMPVVFALRN